MSGRSTALHLLICAALVFLFGSKILSLSIDFALHYGLVDALMKTGVADPQTVGVMSAYPRLGHWMAAGFGYLIGSGVVAMWLVSIVAIYVCYYCLARIAAHDGKPVVVFGFVALTLVAIRTFGTVGYEVIGNFFYPQVVGTAIYFLTLLMLIKSRNAWLRLCIVLGLFAFTLEVHTVPALHMAAAFFLLLVIEVALELVRNRRVSLPSAVQFISFPIGVFLVLWFDPSLRTAITLAQSDGVLGFTLNPVLLVAMAAAAALVAAGIFWKKLREEAAISTADLVIFAALWAALGLVLAQYAAFVLIGNGSPYIVKKHIFIVVTLGTISLAQSAGYALSHRRAPISAPILAACASAAICVMLLSGPGISLYPIVRQLEYAEGASRFAEFKPGNTFTVAASIYPVVQYLISATAFKSGMFDPKSLGLVNGSFVAERDAAFVMADRSPDLVARCKERHEETPDFAIVPSSCLRLLSPHDVLLSFNAGGNGGPYLSGGWWPQEPWGVWAQGTAGLVTVRLPSELQNSDIQMSVAATAFVVPNKPTLTVDIAVNDRQLAVLSLPQEQQLHSIQVPRELTESGALKIAFTARDAVSPLSVGHNGDGRVLGFGLKTLKFEKAQK
jgi:hypothetical protein